MKDFYDVYGLLERRNIREDVLSEAIQNTFSQRKTPFQKNHVVFTEEFAKNTKRQEEWKSFLRKMNKFVAIERVDFELVMATMPDEYPVWLEAVKTKIRTAQIKAIFTVNSKMIAL